ncbi:MAG: DUF2460 domain-containing protein [Rhodomicrobium sp.]
MTTPVFPFLPAIAFPAVKKPSFSTVIADHTSGREVRTQLWQNPRWDFEMTITGLDSSANGQYPGLGSQSLQTLLGFFGMVGGSFTAFVFYDPTDYLVSNQAFGIGDGTTLNFQLIRYLGGMPENVIAPVATTTTLYFSSGNVSAVAPAIYNNGTLVSASNYSIANGLVTFNSAPAVSAVLSWTGYFGFLCRFTDDDLELSQTMANLWEAKSVKFKSLRYA